MGYVIKARLAEELVFAVHEVLADRILFPHLSASENSFTDVSLRRPVPLDLW